MISSGRLLLPPALGEERALQPLAVPAWVVRLERRVFPVAVEGVGEGLQQVRLLDVGESDIPLQPVGQRRSGEVGRADVAGREAVSSVEQPGLGVQPRGPGLVGDLHLGAEFDELVDGALVGGADVRGGDDTEATTAPSHVRDPLLQDAESLPFDEGAEQIDAVSRLQFSIDLVTDAGLAATVDQQSAGGQRDLRSLRECHGPRRSRPLGKSQQVPAWLSDRLGEPNRLRAERGDRLDDVVGQVDLPRDPGSAVAASQAQSASRECRDVQRQGLVRVSGRERSDLDQVGLDVGEPIAHLDGQQVLVQAR